MVELIFDAAPTGKVAPKFIITPPTSLGVSTLAANKPTAPKTLTQRMEEIADKDGMKPDDPIRLMMVGNAMAIDELRGAIAGFGPDSGRLAAEAAAGIMRQESGRLLRGMKGRAFAVLALAGAAVLGVGGAAGWTLRATTPAEVAGAMLPIDMAAAFGRQNWPAQWQARQPLPAGRDGAQWSMVPVLEKPPNPPKR